MENLYDVEADHAQKELHQTKRAEQLGFRPQQEHAIIRQLPISQEDIDKESNEALELIKNNLSQAVLAKEFYPGVIYWANQLHSKFISLYGWKFSKEDHILFLKLFLKLITSLETPPYAIEALIRPTLRLLEKERFLSPTDLVIEWRPLYKLIDRIVYSKDELHGLEYNPHIDKELWRLAMYCRYYFPPSATKEMLDEWRPLLCPYDVTVGKGLQYLQVFLPTVALSEEERNNTWRLWFDEFYDMWDSIHNGPMWERYLITLMTKTAYNNIGHIDWSHRSDAILTRILRIFVLPIGKRNHTAKVNIELHVDQLSRWIVAMMGGSHTKVLLAQLKSLFKSIELYYHPSNNGSWTNKLLSFMTTLTRIVVERIHYERYKKLYWFPKIPESHKLTDEDITEFVNMMIPISHLALYSKQGSGEASNTLRLLACLRPELVAPNLFERMENALDSLTEPRLLKASLNALTFCMQPIMSSRKYYPQGRQQYIEILVQLLPAVDTNDIPKSVIALSFITTCFEMIDIKNFTELVSKYPQMSEHERDLCLSTAQFDDFAVQYLDRAFHFIESVNLDNDSRMHVQEHIAVTFLTSSLHALMSHCSHDIYKLCLDKTYKFVMNRLFTGKAAILGTKGLCMALVHHDRVTTTQKFIPALCDNIKEIFQDNPEIIDDEKPDKTLHWNISILTQVVKHSGSEIIKYKDELLEVCRLSLQMLAVNSHTAAAVLVQSILSSQFGYYRFGYTCNKHDKDIPINNWGKLYTMYDIDIKWHIPTKAEFETAFEFLDSLFVDQVKLLEEFGAGKQALTKDELLKCLTIISIIFQTAKKILPLENDEVVTLNQHTELPLTTWRVSTIETNEAYQEVMSEKWKRFRLRLFAVTQKALNHVLSVHEGYVKAIAKMVAIYSELFAMDRCESELTNKALSQLSLLETQVTNPVFGVHRKSLTFMSERSGLFKNERSLKKRPATLFKMNDEILSDLRKLSSSHYLEIRKHAQRAFVRGVKLSPPYAYERYVSHIIEDVRRGPQDDHKAYKGALYLMHDVILNKHLLLIPCNQQWEVLRQVCPAIIASPHTDKVSIGKLYERMATSLQGYYATLTLKQTFSEETVGYGEQLLNTVKQSCVNEKYIHDSNTRLQLKSEENCKLYEELIISLLELIEKGNLSWRNSEFATGMLLVLLRRDVKFNIPMVNMFFENLIANTLASRQMATSACATILCALKRPHKVIMKSVHEITGITPTTDFNPGYRHDNTWHHYNSEDLLDTKAKFESATFIEKTHWGYYSWPKKLKTYAPFDQQPKLDRTRDDLSEVERIIFDKFSDAEFIKKLIEYNCLEEVKGQDKLDNQRVDLFKGLFRNFGDSFLGVFRPHIERLSEDTQESNQRCVAEVITGLIVGSKHWTFDMLESLWLWLLPVIHNILAKVSVEMVRDWDNAFAMMLQNRDPRRMFWLIEYLMKDVLSGTRSLFAEASHVYLLQSGLHQQEWRVGSVLHRLLAILETKLDSNYKNIREKVGSILTSLFFYDVELCNKSHLRLSPRRGEFLKRVLPKIHSEDMATSIVTTQQTSTRRLTAATAKPGPSSIAMPLPTEIAMAMSQEGPVEIPEAILQQLKQSITEDANGGSDGLSAFHMQSFSQRDDIGRDAMPKDVAMEEDVDVVANDSNHSDQVRMLKTLMKWLVCSQRSTLQPFIPEILPMLPVICEMSPVDTVSSDDELNRDVQLSMSHLAQSYVPKKYLSNVVDTIQQISACDSWHARYTVLTYTQVFVFNNNITLQAQTSLPDKLYSVVMKLLQDEKVEVREMASKTLGGLLQCGFLAINDELNTFIKTKCKTKISKRKRSETYDPEELHKRIVSRHAGVLAVSSCLMSVPYDVHEWVPELVMRLSDHLHDPQPIEGTVKKAVSEFKRTHLDTWHIEKQKFTSEQLSVLSDLLVSPSYYA